MVLSTFSSKKDEFLDKLSNLDENLQFSYVSRIEKYIIMNEEESDTLKEEDDQEDSLKEKNHSRNKNTVFNIL